VRGYLGTLLDITDRRRAEEELRAAHARMRRFFDAGIVGTFVAELDGRVVEANDYWLRLIGATREQLERGELDWRTLTEPDAAPLDESALAELRRNGTSAPYEKWYRLPDGRRVPVLVARATMPGPVEQVASFVLDMTERRAALTGMARLVAAIEQTSESVVVTDVDAGILYVNPAFERVSGYTFAEVRGTNPSVLKSGVQTPEFYASMWATLTAGSTWTGELVNRRKDGREYVEEASISPMRDERGQITAYVAVKRDVTGERTLEAQLRQAQRLEAIGSLAGGVAHDFNNLLTAIHGYGELVLDALPTGSESRADVGELLRAADRASALTRQLLAFSRRQVLAPEVLDPGAVIDDLEPMLRRLLGAHILLSTSRTADLGRVRADPGQLEQVVVNLAVNARDAMPGGGRLDISSGNAQGPDGPVVRIAVSDTGAGMEAETLARVFEPFFTTKEEGKGTGMGLATVYGIVRQSNGTISVASAKGSGTTFTIDLPRVEAAAGDGPGGTETGATRPGRRQPRGQSILLVEDQDPVRAVAARILERQGYRVALAASGAEALAIVAAADEPFDLLLTDVRMPGIQGPEVARRLRVIQPGLKVLFMSGFAAEAGGADELLAGTPVIDKPFDAATLGRNVAAALGAPR
jgi:PAS domain S-box-containing protein